MCLLALGRMKCCPGIVEQAWPRALSAVLNQREHVDAVGVKLSVCFHFLRREGATQEITEQ